MTDFWSRQGRFPCLNFWTRERGGSPDWLLDQRVEVILANFQMRERGGSPD